VIARRTLLALAFLFAPRPAEAQEAALSETVATESPEYSVAIDAALSDFQARRWNEARTHFREAHALSPNARTLRGIGMASFEMADYPAAFDALDAALVNGERPLTDEQRVQVTELRERAHALFGRFTIPACADARVLVDDVPIVPSGAWPEGTGEVSLGLGAHSVLMRRARGTDTVSSRTRLEVAGGESGVALELVCPDRTLPNVSHASADETPWMVAGVGGGVLVLGAVLTVVGVLDAASVENASLGDEWASLSAANERAPILTGIGIPLLAAGAAVAATGLVWGLVNLQPTTPARNVISSLQLRVGPSGVLLNGSFE
jgi:hypothetical protein